MSGLVWALYGMNQLVRSLIWYGIGWKVSHRVWLQSNLQFLVHHDALQVQSSNYYILGWPDTVQGLLALKKKVIICTLSNGNVRLLIDMVTDFF